MAQGCRLATSVGGVLTGRGPDIPGGERRQSCCDRLLGWRLAQDPFAAYQPASSAIGVARNGQITRSPKFDRSTE
jgi:hypothetical protein